MYYNKQIYIYCLLSFLLSLIITTFYVKKINEQYYFVFILLFILFYLFFYLMNLENKEDFNNFSYYVEGYDKLYESNNVKEEHHHVHQEENHHVQHHNVQHHNVQHHNKIQEEEDENSAPPQEENYESPQEETEYNLPKRKNNIDLEGMSIKNTVKCSPVNINIYNGDKSDNSKKDDDSCKKSKNLGDYKSRVYNNSDWIYGNNAWTNTPDFYIPTPNDLLPTYNNNVQNISQKQNEVLLKKKFSDSKIVCPMMVNTPWSEYKSGDKEPEGFNI
jgi:hypothetical protein